MANLALHLFVDLKGEVEPTIRLMPQTVPLDIASLGERSTLKQRNFGA